MSSLVLSKLFMFVDVTFTTHDSKWCNSLNGEGSGNLDTCKQACAGRSDCAGAVIVPGKYYFLRESCKDNLISSFGATVYLKTVN